MIMLNISTHVFTCIISHSFKTLKLLKSGEVCSLEPTLATPLMAFLCSLVNIFSLHFLLLPQIVEHAVIKIKQDEGAVQ